MIWTNKKIDRKNIVKELQFWDCIRTIKSQIVEQLEEIKNSDQHKYIEKYRIQKELYNLPDDEIWKLMSVSENNRLDLQNKLLNNLQCKLRLYWEEYSHINDYIVYIKQAIKTFNLKIGFDVLAETGADEETINQIKNKFKKEPQ